MRTCPTTLVQKGETVNPQSLLTEVARMLDRPRQRGRFTRFTVIKLEMFECLLWSQLQAAAAAPGLSGRAAIWLHEVAEQSGSCSWKTQ